MEESFQEAISLITIVAILVGVGAYVAAVKNVPLFVSGAVLGGGAGLPFVSCTNAPTGRRGASVSCSSFDRNGILHLHDTASLLVGGSIQPSRN